MPLVSRTRATLRSAEFGFFGVFVYTRVQTPRRWGAPFRAAVFVLVDFDSRPLRTSCWIVGTDVLTGCERGGPPRTHPPSGRPTMLRARALWQQPTAYCPVHGVPSRGPVPLEA